MSEFYDIWHSAQQRIRANHEAASAAERKEAMRRTEEDAAIAARAEQIQSVCIKLVDLLHRNPRVGQIELGHVFEEERGRFVSRSRGVYQLVTRGWPLQMATETSTTGMGG